MAVQPTDPHASTPRDGFSLLELSAVALLIGALAAFGLPRWLQCSERSKAAEAFTYLESVRTAQLRHHADNGCYTSDITKLDVEHVSPTYFSMGIIEATRGKGFGASWALKLQRCGSKLGYGDYVIAYTHGGFDAAESSIDRELIPAGCKLMYRN